MAVVESWQWWMVGDTFLTISLAGCADFTVSYEVDPADSCVGVGCAKSREIREWVIPKATRSFVSG